MAACDLDFSALPILTGCPADNELILVGNAVGGLDVNGMPTVGYGRRQMGDVRKCFLGKIVFTKLQFTVGQVGSPMTAGQTQLVITQNNILADSVMITLGGSVLPENDNTQVSYATPVYTGTNVTINFDLGVSNGQQYIVYYAYAS